MAPFKLFQTIQINITAFPCQPSTASSILTQAKKYIAFKPNLIPLNQESKEFLLEAIKTHNPKSLEQLLDEAVITEKSDIHQIKQ
jgi:hypothetical protein